MLLYVLTFVVKTVGNWSEKCTKGVLAQFISIMWFFDSLMAYCTTVVSIT